MTIPAAAPAPAHDHAARATDEAVEHFHPLEVIPYFRRWPCSFTRDLVYTFIWNFGFGVFFFGMNLAFGGRNANVGTFLGYLIISNLIGYAIHGFYGLGSALGLERWARRAGFAMKVVYYATIPIVAVFFGFWVASLFMDVGFRGWMKSPAWILSIMLTSVVISMVLSVVFFWRERTAVAAAALARERERGERVEREAALANLRALQAQIEPHFLFNTLANVTGLIDPDPAKAKRMLESFIRFLRASLAATRRESTTLGEEAELIGAFLDVLAIRMGSRLRYRIDLDPSLATFALPPMLLQPVVENAIKHGLEPKIDGGEIVVSARREGDLLSIEIADTGIGFASTTAGGVGLTNIRDRLRLLYGERASLAIRENMPTGTVVALRLPA